MKSDKPAALDVRGLMVHYGASPIVWDLHLAVPSGHLVGIMGPNGAGKTTFIKAVLELLEGTTGVVRLLGHKLKTIRRKIAYVPQRELVDWDFPMTVRDLVEMGCYPKRGLFRPLQREDHQRVEKALDKLGLTSMTGVQIGELSGGQRQRAFVSRAIAQDADVYFLDEPFGGIDQVSEHILMEVLRDLRDEGKTIFVVHHDLVTAGKYFDWAILMNTRLIANGPMQKVFTSENLYMTYGKNLALVEDVVKILSTFAEGRAVHGCS